MALSQMTPDVGKADAPTVAKVYSKTGSGNPARGFPIENIEAANRERALLDQSIHAEVAALANDPGFKSFRAANDKLHELAVKNHIDPTLFQLLMIGKINKTGNAEVDAQLKVVQTMRGDLIKTNPTVAKLQKDREARARLTPVGSLHHPPHRVEQRSLFKRRNAPMMARK